MISLDCFCGKKLGEGSSRHVYQYALDSDYVVKIDDKAQTFQNIMEWEVWRTVMDKAGTNRWFAPCKYISPSGTILIQRKTISKPFAKYPDKIPSFFADRKLDNFGFINNHLVAHDYGVNNLIENGYEVNLEFANWDL